MVLTYKNKFNNKYGFPKDASHSVAEVARLTGYKKSGLDTIIMKGKGAFFSSPQSIRPNVKTPEQWSMARLYSAVMGGKAAKIDAKQLVK
jgi:hypothetical protein